MATAKVILLDNVAKLGRKYDVKDVPAGFARNFLIPQNKAMLATKGSLGQVSKWQEEAKEERNKAYEAFGKEADKLKGIVVELKAKANEEGHLYGAIHPEDVVEKISTDQGLLVDPSWLSLPASIKELGDYEVTVGEGKDKIEFTLQITAE